MTWTVQHADKVGSQPHVVRELQLIAAEMIRDGQHPGDTVVFGPGDSVLWVEESGEVVGVMCFQQPEPHQSYTWVSLSYVRPDYRRRGVHRAMNERVEEEAKKIGAKTVERMVAEDNTRMQAVMERLGYERLRTTYGRATP